MESFQHITKQGRTTPGFFRLLETLYAYQMREENLQSHTDADWLILCQSSGVLNPREKLTDAVYIDKAVIDYQESQSAGQEKDLARAFTMESTNKIGLSLSLASYMIEKLKREETKWPYSLSSMEIIHVKELKDGLYIDAIEQA